MKVKSLSCVQLLQLYVTTGKAIALTTETFIGRVIALPFNTLSRFAIAFPLVLINACVGNLPKVNDVFEILCMTAVLRKSLLLPGKSHGQRSLIGCSP